MTATLTAEQRLTLVEREIEGIKQRILETATALQDSPKASTRASWDELGRRVRDLRPSLAPEDYDKAQLAELFTALLDVRDLLDAAGPGDLDTLDALLIGIERIRHVVRDALDEQVTGIAAERGRVAEQLIEALPGVTRDAIAELLGVDRRTLTRWRTEAGAPSPRLKAVARVARILEHDWTDAGVVAWFHRPRRDLGGAPPIALLDSRVLDEDALVSAARAGRSQYAS